MKNKTVWVLAAIFLTLILIFAFADLPIMQAVANPKSSWAYVLEAYGMLPGMMMGFAGNSLLLRLSKPKKSVVKS